MTYFGVPVFLAQGLTIGMSIVDHNVFNNIV